MAEPSVHVIPEPVTIEETGLQMGFLADLTLKALYQTGRATAGQLGATLALSQPVMQEVLTFLSRDGLCEVTGSEGHALADYRYSITGRGRERTAAAFEQSAYLGRAPVPLANYVSQVSRQSVSQVRFDVETVERALDVLILSPETRRRIGRAIASGRPTLIYGASGNGKSTAARQLGAALGGQVLIPHALEVYGHIVRLFDPSKHQVVQDISEGQGATRRRDRRWQLVARPAVLTSTQSPTSSFEPAFPFLAKGMLGENGCRPPLGSSTSAAPQRTQLTQSPVSAPLLLVLRASCPRTAAPAHFKEVLIDVKAPLRSDATLAERPAARSR